MPSIETISPVWVTTYALMLGLCVGSFLNVVILRLPKMMAIAWRRDCHEYLDINDTQKQHTSFNLVFPASHCPKCNHKIKPWENIPAISYLFLKGKCSNCGVKIPFRYPLIELITGLLSAFVVWKLGATISGGMGLLLTWSLVCLTVIDIDEQLLPDSITLPLMWLGLLLSSYGIFTDLSSAVWGAAMGYLSLWSVYWAFKFFTGKEGMGFGDFKLLAALGAWMGWQSLPLIILLSSLVGAVIGIGMVVAQGKDKSQPIPFGPYLAIAGWIAFFWGDVITQAYLGSF